MFFNFFLANNIIRTQNYQNKKKQFQSNNKTKKKNRKRVSNNQKIFIKNAHFTNIFRSISLYASTQFTIFQKRTKFITNQKNKLCQKRKSSNKISPQLNHNIRRLIVKLKQKQNSKK